MASEIHVGDIGTIFEPTARDEQEAIIGLADATVLRLRFLKPNGTLVEKVATLSNDGSDGKMRYVTSAASDLDLPGIWRAEGYVEKPAGKWTGNQHRFRVYPNLGAAATQYAVSGSESLKTVDGPPSQGLV